jgi:2-oxoglutarate ferredoxin oxidoreductase subunit delta
MALDDIGKAVVARGEDCICCRLCEFRCPDLAIEMPFILQYDWRDVSP